MKTLSSFFVILLILITHSAAKADPTFSMHNRGFAPVLIQIGPTKTINDAKFLRVEKDGYVDANVNLKDENTLIIYNLGKFVVNRATFAPNKTIFVSWDDTSLKPQRGTLGLGLSTGKGYSLKNNVSEAEIKAVRAR